MIPIGGAIVLPPAIHALLGGLFAPLEPIPPNMLALADTDTEYSQRIIVEYDPRGYQSVDIKPRIEDLKLSVPMEDNFPDIFDNTNISEAILRPTLKNLVLYNLKRGGRQNAIEKHNKNLWIVNLLALLPDTYIQRLSIDGCDEAIRVTDIKDLFKTLLTTHITSLTLRRLPVSGTTWKKDIIKVLPKTHLEKLDIRSILRSGLRIGVRHNFELCTMGYSNVPFSTAFVTNCLPPTLRQLKIDFTFDDLHTIVTKIPTSGITHLTLNLIPTTADIVDRKTKEFKAMNNEAKKKYLEQLGMTFRDDDKDLSLYLLQYFHGWYFERIPFSMAKLMDSVGDLLSYNQLRHLEISGTRQLKDHDALWYSANRYRVDILESQFYKDIHYTIPKNNTTIEELSIDGVYVTEESQCGMLTNQIMCRLFSKMLRNRYWGLF